MDGLRRSARTKNLDMDFFSNLSVGEGKADDDEVLSQVTSVPSTLASGSMTNPRPRGSSPSKAMREDMDLLKGQMTSVQEALARLLQLPALQASVPTGEKVLAKPGSPTKGRSRSQVVEGDKKSPKVRDRSEPRRSAHTSRRNSGGSTNHPSDLESGHVPSLGGEGDSDCCSRCGLRCESKCTWKEGSFDDDEEARATEVEEVPRTDSACGGSWLSTDDFDNLPTDDETLPSLGPQSVDEYSADFDMVETFPLSIFDCDADLFSDSDYSPSVWDGSEGETAKWTVGELDLIGYGVPKAFLRRIPREAREWTRVKVFLEPRRPDSFYFYIASMSALPTDVALRIPQCH